MSDHEKCKCGATPFAGKIYTIKAKGKKLVVCEDCLLDVAVRHLGECDKNPIDADEITLDNWEKRNQIIKCRKKPIIVHALQINYPEGFEVTTSEGKLFGKPGDYLMFGVKGEKYPCDKEIFEQTYNVVEE